MLTGFVAGATGYTGREVVRALGARGLHAVAHVRPDSKRLNDWRPRFEEMGAAVDTTPWRLEALQSTFQEKRPDMIFALLGTTRARAKREHDSAIPETYKAVDYGLTRMLLDAALGARIRPRFVFLSSTGVSEGSRAEYLRVKYVLEKELAESGLPYVIARPSVITGTDRDDGRTVERLSAIAIDSALGIAGLFGARQLQERYRSTTNSILADALVRLALDPGAKNRVIESEGLRG